MNAQIHKLENWDINKFNELIRVFEDVFEMENFIMPNKGYLQQLLEKEGFFVFVATLSDEVIGGLTAYTLPSYYFQSQEVYVYDLAVKKAWQRKGVGKKLMTAIVGYCDQMGMKEVFVQADLEDGHAVDFYRSTGASEQSVAHFSYSLGRRCSK